MNGLLHNYKSSLLLLAGIVVGGLLGWFVPAVAPWVAPVGHIFMNLLFVLIVPLVFFSVTSSVCALSKKASLGRTLLVTAVVMLLFLTCLVLIAYAAMLICPPVESSPDMAAQTMREDTGLGDILVDAVTVKDFAMLFSIRHILPLMIVSLLMGVGVARLGNNKVMRALSLCNNIVVEMMECIMRFAPLGLGCYFAGMMAGSGSGLVSGYGKVLALYLVLTAFVYLVLNPLAGTLSLRGKGAFRRYWQAVVNPSLMAVSTLSSSACMPANIAAAKQMGGEPLIAESVVPLGTQLFKQGSAMTCAIKTGFVLLLCGHTLATPEAFATVLVVALLASIVVGAVPTGAGTAELFICSVLGADPKVAGLLIVISTLLDMPATLLNVNGNTILPVIVSRFATKKADE